MAQKIVSLRKASELMGVSYRRAYQLAIEDRLPGLIEMEGEKTRRFAVKLNKDGGVTVEERAHGFQKINKTGEQ